MFLSPATVVVFKRLKSGTILPDIAILCKETEMAELLIENGGLTFRQIKEIAATRIQTHYRSYKIRTSFEEHKDLLLK